MKVTAALYLLLTVSLYQASPETTYFREGGGVDGKEYITEVSEEELAMLPKWPMDSENPPVGVRLAASLAKNALSNQFAHWEKEWELRLNSMTLTPCRDDNWFWGVEFHWLPRRFGIVGPAPKQWVFVLMDGTVRGPKLKVIRRPVH